jgi:hypothetical protein
MTVTQVDNNEKIPDWKNQEESFDSNIAAGYFPFYKEKLPQLV